MKQFKKLAKLIIISVLTLNFFTPINTKASSPSRPTITLDFYYEGITIYDEPYGCGTSFGTQYSNFKFEPYNSSLTLKVDAECSAPKTAKLTILCIDATTNTSVGSKTIYATNNQYITFSGLNPSRQYYFQFSGSGYSFAGKIYLSKNGIF